MMKSIKVVHSRHKQGVVSMEKDITSFLAGVIDGHEASIDLVETMLNCLNIQKKAIEDQLEYFKKTGKIDREIGMDI